MLKTSLTKPVNVLAVVTAMEAGGLETSLFNVLTAIDRTKFNVTIVCTGRDSNWFADELDSLGIKTLFCHNPYSQIGYVRRLGRIIRDLKIDVVFDLRDDFSASTLWAAKRAGVRSRVVWYQSSRHNFESGFLRNMYAGLMHQGVKRWATRIVGCSEKVLNVFYPGRKHDDRFTVVYNGVDLAKFVQPTPAEVSSLRKELGIPANRILIGHVGRFHRAKNHPGIIKSFARLRGELENVHLLLVGEGDLRPEVEQAIREAGVGDHVTLAGRRKDVPAMLGIMDVYFFPSVYEGMPLALAEAMTAGLPIVASNIQEIVEITPESLRQQLFAPTDSEGLAGAL